MLLDAMSSLPLPSMQAAQRLCQLDIFPAVDADDAPGETHLYIAVWVRADQLPAERMVSPLQVQ